eukprot:1099132-Prorocentrum_lima.AAC.1
MKVRQFILEQQIELDFLGDQASRASLHCHHVKLNLLEWWQEYNMVNIGSSVWGISVNKYELHKR